MAASVPSQYDGIAEMYHKLWADWYLPAASPALERYFFSRVPREADVLDLCCGSGHVTRELVAHRYRVTGVDNSAELLALAHREISQAEFRLIDARALPFREEFDAVLSTFDSLNHILNIGELEQVFRGVYQSLRVGGLFFFDMNLVEAYSFDAPQWTVDLKTDSVGLVRGRFDHASRKSHTELIWFTRKPEGDCWRRECSTVEQQCYSQTEILLALSAAGFRDTETISAREAGVAPDLALGRTYFSARRQV